VELELVPTAEQEIVEAARRAAVAAGIGRADDERGRWWRVGLEDALGARSVTPSRGPAYVAAPSPRSTRGATRA
jgi:hypothetical protein